MVVGEGGGLFQCTCIEEPNVLFFIFSLGRDMEKEKVRVMANQAATSISRS